MPHTNTEMSTEEMIEKVFNTITKRVDKNIILLKNKEVIQWLYGDLSFLPSIEKKNKTADEAKYKALEDAWGQSILKARRPDLKLDKQWTTCFGQHICEELYALLGSETSKPKKKEHYEPDRETFDKVIEVKTQTYHTTGTAGEKILGCPFKYAEIPDLYSKPLVILCVGGAEKISREQYGNLNGPKTTPQKKRFLEFFKENKIEYISATELLNQISNL